MVPWRDRALFGTWESSTTCEAGDTSIADRDVAAFIDELNHSFPALDLTPVDVTLVHRGVVPAAVRGGTVALEGHEIVRDHGADGVHGLFSVPGTKYTTARAVAERVTDALLVALQKPAVRCRTASTPLPGGTVHDIGLAIANARREHDEGLPTDTIPHLIAAYGSRYSDVLELAAGRPELKKRIVKGLPAIGAELLFAARHEMAVTLADALIRRTPAGALGYPGEDAVARAAEIVGAELRWPEPRRAAETAAVKTFYGTLNALNT
jgi:glycerol-3-phosphate dehydrogenase